MLVEQAVLSLKRAAWSFRVLPGDAVVSGQHQTTNILNHLHTEMGHQPPVTSFTCCFASFPSLQGLEVLVVSWTWTCPFSLRNEVFRWSAMCAVLASPFTPVIHLSWPNKLGRWQRGPWVVDFMSDCPCPWWVACQSCRAPSAPGI